MDKKIYEILKSDLKKAIEEKDYEKINEIRKLLNISQEQATYFDKGLTGFPSIDKPWLQYYKPNAEELANNIPLNKTVWDVIEEKLIEYYEYPAIEYFGRTFSREEFIDSCYTWARTFRAMGVAENEIVPIYGPFVPDICAMVFGLNMIGACPYFLKLAISPEALAEETREAKIAVVYDGMWINVANEFMKDKFKKVIVASVPTDMPSPKKEIVSFINKIQAIKSHSQIPNDKKYIWSDKAKEIADYYTGEVKVPFQPNRSTFITSSSGTTVGGVVKGTVATNESTISQLYMGDVSDTQFYPGDRCLNHFPPTASTSLNLLFLTALYKGETIILDPRVSEKDFYNQLVNLKPNQALHTGSAWEAFFNRVEKEMKAGKKFDFSYAKGWTIGGEGTDVKKFLKWNEIMSHANCQRQLFYGYGSSELFSATCASKIGAEDGNKKQIMSVGLPYAGITLGIFSQDGQELPYNKRGEIYINSKSAMKEYYNKPELTQKIKKDNWIHTGDIGEIDERGFVYVWGRANDSINSLNDKTLYLFDISNIIKNNSYIDDAIVLELPVQGEEKYLVAHLVWKKDLSQDEKSKQIVNLNEMIQSILPENTRIIAYSDHSVMLPYSPTTLKKDKNRLSNQRTGFYNVIDDSMVDIQFILTENGKYSLNYTQGSENKKLVLK